MQDQASDCECTSDEDAAVESEVAHSNPFAALNSEEEDMSAESAAELDNLNGSPQQSAATSAGTAGLDGSDASSTLHFFPEQAGNRHERDLPAQRQAILARVRRSNAGVSKLHVLRTSVTSLHLPAFMHGVKEHHLSLFCGPRRCEIHCVKAVSPVRLRLLYMLGTPNMLL